MLQTSAPKFAFFTETWLTSNVPDSVLYISGYNILREDRLDKRGGGLCAYYDNNFHLKRFFINGIPPKCEHICFIHNFIIYVLFYLPPSTPIPEVHQCFNLLIEKIDEILSKYPSYKICISGDFNRFDVSYLCDSLNLKNIVNANTRYNALLDYCLVSKSIYLNFCVTVKDPVSTSDHNAILCYFRHDQASQKIKKEFFDYRKSNMDLFAHSVSNIDWQPFYNTPSVDDKCHYFTNSIKRCMSLIPKYEVSMSSKDKTWITPLCKHLINKRWQAFRSHDFEKYNHYKSKVQEEIIKAKQLFYVKCKRSNKGMWQFMKKTFKSNEGHIKNLKKEDETLEILANRVNESLIMYFNPATKTSHFQPQNKDDAVPFTLSETFFGLQALAANKATGSDGIPNKCLKSISYYITEPLCHIFNCAMETHEFPSLWKVADITPVPKTKQITLNKLRPISLLPNAAKIFEKLILKRSVSFFHSVIDCHQFGFMPQSSTSACLINIQHAIASYLNSSHVIAISVISFDLEKAFDCLPHSILLEKLINVLPKNIFYLISSYLSNRYQQVKILNTRSYPLQITSGVPQGGILSPILFNVFISDLNFGNDCKYFKYADDTTVILPHYANTITKDVDNKVQIMENWCTNNSLRLNKTKTQILTITKKKNINLHANHCDNIKILGVWFSSNFKWQTQVNYVLFT